MTKKQRRRPEVIRYALKETSVFADSKVDNQLHNFSVLNFPLEILLGKALYFRLVCTPWKAHKANSATKKYEVILTTSGSAVV